jgi:hypothetical protein
VFLDARSHYVENEDLIHGFIKNRSVITCAAKHIGYETTLSFDVKNYFDSITYNMIDETLKEANINIPVNKDFHFVQRPNGNYTLAQGFASSPIFASIYSLRVARDLVAYISVILKREDFTVTVYADDISISTRLHRNYEIEDMIKEIVASVLEKNKLEINPKKTRVMRASNGNRRILGIMVGKDDLFPTQKTKRRLRACKHYVQKYESFEDIVKGLEEWTKLKLGKTDKNFIKTNKSQKESK